MKGALKKYFACLILVISVFFGSNLHGQMLHDSSTVRLLYKEVTYMYNFHFSEARQISEEINRLYPGHPAVILLNSVIDYWENYPILPSSPVRGTFEKNLRTCMDICEKNGNTANETEYLLINLCARGLLLLFMTDNELTLDIVPLALSTYQYIRKSFSFTSEYFDFNYFKGVFDYYREEYPEKYPVYKPIAALFPRGDKVRGLKELWLAADSAIFLRAEALAVLEDIFLRFENNDQSATFCNRTLYEHYPGNPQFMEEYIKNLLYIRQYDKAESLISKAGNFSDLPFSEAQMKILKGILAEKKYHNNHQAEELYRKGLAEIKPFGKYADEYSSYAYYGLSRISSDEGDRHLRKAYRKEANRLSRFKKMNFDN